MLVLALALPAAPALAAAGALDPGFDPGAGVAGVVFALAVQGDGKVLIGGSFTTVDGVGRNNIARLNADGSLDTSFDPSSGPNAEVYALAVQPDGKVLLGGEFTAVAGRPRRGVARLNAGGSLDTGFDPGAGTDGGVLALALQPDGKVLLGGFFTTVDGVARNNIARLNAGGSLDTGFDPGAGTDGDVLALALQPDGKVLLGGSFTEAGGAGRNNIARLNADGSLDAGFDPGPGTDGNVYALVARGDGRVLLGGSFTMADGVARANIARLGADGRLDASFDPGAGPDSAVLALAAQADGKVLLGGLFTNVATAPRAGVARLEGQASSQGDQTISFATLPDRVYGDPPFTVSATASSGLPVSFSSLTPAVCAVSGSVVSMRAAGECAIAADRPAGGGFAAAPRMTQAFVVRRKPLTVVADDATRLEGQANPAFTVRYQGFAGGDTAAALTGGPACVTPAKPSSPAGQYPITCTAGTLAAANYSFRFVPGVLTVRPLYRLYLPALTG